MSQILLFSFDCLSSPSIDLKTMESIEEISSKSYGRGFAWYNQDELSATVVKEEKLLKQSALVTLMHDSSRFNSTIFIGHVRGAAKRLVQQDTQPFIRAYAGRHWVFIHSGDLNSDYKTQIPLNKDSQFEPIGTTDSEHVFCYLLEKIKNLGARSLSEVDSNQLHEWLKEINKLGTANISLSDGLDILIYHDMNAFNPLYWLRSSPPHALAHFDTSLFSIDITQPFDVHHTFVLIANQKLFNDAEPMKPSQMFIIRRGQIIWNNSAYPELIKEPEKHSNIIVPDRQKVVSTPPEIYKIKHEKLADDKKKKHIIDQIVDTPRKFYTVSHETIYHYDTPVEISKHLFHLRPLNDEYQALLNYELSISVLGQGDSFEDVFENIATFYQINSPYHELIIKAKSIVSIAENPAQYSEYVHQRREMPLLWLPWQRTMISPYLLPPELPESELNELIDFAMSFVKRNDYDLMEVLKDINLTIYNDFNYLPGSTSITSTPYELFVSRTGVCQDFANLFICLARLLNVPARYRTGYIYTGSDYRNEIQSEESHAWVELYLPFIGWYGFDPTNGCIVERSHVRVACGRNYLDASPTTGTIYKGGEHETLKANVKIEQLK